LTLAASPLSADRCLLPISEVSPSLFLVAKPAGGDLGTRRRKVAKSEPVILLGVFAPSREILTGGFTSDTVLPSRSRPA